MQIDGHVQALREDLGRVASLGDEATAHVAQILSEAIESSLARQLQDILAEAALELNAQLDSGHVEVRIAGREPELVFVSDDGSAPEAVDEAFSARIDTAASREGASVNTWLVQALQRAVEPRRPSSSGRNRLTGYGRS